MLADPDPDPDAERVAASGANHMSGSVDVDDRDHVGAAQAVDGLGDRFLQAPCRPPPAACAPGGRWLRWERRGWPNGCGQCRYARARARPDKECRDRRPCRRRAAGAAVPGSARRCRPSHSRGIQGRANLPAGSGLHHVGCRQRRLHTWVLGTGNSDQDTRIRALKGSSVWLQEGWLTFRHISCFNNNLRTSLKTFELRRVCGIRTGHSRPG